MRCKIDAEKRGVRSRADSREFRVGPPERAGFSDSSFPDIAALTLPARALRLFQCDCLCKPANKSDQIQPKYDHSVQNQTDYKRRNPVPLSASLIWRGLASGHVFGSKRRSKNGCDRAVAGRLKGPRTPVVAGQTGAGLARSLNYFAPDSRLDRGQLNPLLAKAAIDKRKGQFDAVETVLDLQSEESSPKRC